MIPFLTGSAPNMYRMQGDVLPTKSKNASRKPGKAKNRAMATRSYHNVLILVYWRAQLMRALRLVQVK